MQSDQVCAVVRQLARGQSLVEGLRQAFDHHAVGADQAQAVKEMLDGPWVIARQHFYQVTRQPALRRRRCEAQQIDVGTDAVAVDQAASVEGPVFVAGGLPGFSRCLTADVAQLLLPGEQGLGVAAVDFHGCEQWVAALMGQPEVQTPGEAAELLVLTVAQGQYRIVQAFERQILAQHVAFETPCAVGGFTVAEGADDEQGMLRLAQVLAADAAQRLHIH
jgi:hypothetical protein